MSCSGLNGTGDECTHAYVCRSHAVDLVLNLFIGACAQADIPLTAKVVLRV